MTIALKSAGPRQLKNTLARWLITLGGVSVLFTLVLIFLYLLYVIEPIFADAEVEQEHQFAIQSGSSPATIGVDELKELAYVITNDGTIDYYQLKANDEYQVGDQSYSQDLLDGAFALEQVINVSIDKKLLVAETGKVKLLSPKFVAQFDQGKRTILPNLVWPLGEDYIEVDAEGESLKLASFAMNDEKAVYVAFTDDFRLIKTTLIAEDDFNYDPSHEIVYQTIAEQVKQVNEILVTPDLSMAFIRSGNQVKVYDLTDEDEVELKAIITPKLNRGKAKPAEITSMALLSGGSSLLIGDSNGQVSQWFEVATENGEREFKQIRTFAAAENEAITAIYTEQYRKSFFTMTASGHLGVFYTTSEADLWHGNIANQAPLNVAISPRADALLMLKNEQLALYKVENEHPEVTWKALWQEVWYEGYPEPEYIWQSTSGSDDFEAKFSLVPISFGTIKAALYAMLFAVPIALTAAIYTAYFMTPAMRKKVKPTIEIMEALPTVILGFLAGLWLAPLVEKYLPAVALLLVFLPLSVFVTAFIWFKLPKELKVKIPETLAPLLLIPAMVLAAYAAFSLSPVLEFYLFGGDVRQYITNDLGIDFDQRNSLVVGIAMGFAVIPTIFSMAEDAIFSVPKHLTSGSLALGATPWQTLVKVVLLTASPGIFSAIMMGLGRAVGETMIVLMATGNTPILDWSLFQGMRTLSANIAVEMPESEVGSSHYRILFLAAFVLFVFTFVFNTLAEFVRQRLREKYSSL